jgi:nitrite reductase/ring-hydroxylating ferredoxin subunit
MDQKSKINRFYIISIVLLIFIGCGQENDEHTVPFTYVNITITLQDPEYIELNAPGNRIFVTGGYNNNGIVIYRSSFYDFKAFDRTCTFNVPDNCRVDGSTNSTVLVKCKCCGSEYELNSGSASKGPSGIPLKQYKTYFNEASGTLTVRN